MLVGLPLIALVTIISEYTMSLVKKDDVSGLAITAVDFLSSLAIDDPKTNLEKTTLEERLRDLLERRNIGVRIMTLPIYPGIDLKVQCYKLVDGCGDHPKFRVFLIEGDVKVATFTVYTKDLRIQLKTCQSLWTDQHIVENQVKRLLAKENDPNCYVNYVCGPILYKCITNVKLGAVGCDKLNNLKNFQSLLSLNDNIIFCLSKLSL